MVCEQIDLYIGNIFLVAAAKPTYLVRLKDWNLERRLRSVIGQEPTMLTHTVNA